MNAARRRGALVCGRRGERHVEQLLRDEGWDVLARNWRGGGGELDLVVRRHHRLRFVEVKTRGNAGANPWESLTERKRRCLRGAAAAWLQAHPESLEDPAFLVAMVFMAPRTWRVDWYDDAF